MRCLVRKEIAPHPWRLHKWVHLDGTVGLFGLVRQCTKCHMVEVTNVLTGQTWRGPASMLKEKSGLRGAGVLR